MIGLARLDNLHHCLRTAPPDDVPGDFVDTGVWRGGACIFARAALEAYSDADRSVWVVDAFRGMPEAGAGAHPGDHGMALHNFNDALAVSRDEVAENFSRYGLLDERVEFVDGWFADTLPTAPIDKIAVLRPDGDLYSSTRVALTELYPKLSPGGFLIVDDYLLAPRRQAVHEYREEQGITEEIVSIDDIGVYWRRGG